MNTSKRKVITDIFESSYEINVLNPIELFATKMAALLNRTIVRDLYDIYNLQKFNIIEEEDFDVLRKLTLAYMVITSKGLDINLDKIKDISYYQVKTKLLPVIRRKEKFDLEVAKNNVIKYVEKLLKFSEEETQFITTVNKNIDFSLLFKDKGMLDIANKHPMVIWKRNNL